MENIINLKYYKKFIEVGPLRQGIQPKVNNKGFCIGQFDN